MSQTASFAPDTFWILTDPGLTLLPMDHGFGLDFTHSQDCLPVSHPEIDAFTLCSSALALLSQHWHTLCLGASLAPVHRL